MKTRIESSTLDLEIRQPMSCRNLVAATFGEALETQATLLVFLRHFG